jgi:hypothetical protein
VNKLSRAPIALSAIATFGFAARFFLFVFLFANDGAMGRRPTRSQTLPKKRKCGDATESLGSIDRRQGEVGGVIKVGNVRVGPSFRGHRIATNPNRAVKR